jgi:hypothetical protein
VLLCRAVDSGLDPWLVCCYKIRAALLVSFYLVYKIIISVAAGSAGQVM